MNKLTQDFINFVKEKYNYKIQLVSSKTPDTFESIFQEEENTMEKSKYEKLANVFGLKLGEPFLLKDKKDGMLLSMGLDRPVLFCFTDNGLYNEASKSRCSPNILLMLDEKYEVIKPTNDEIEIELKQARNIISKIKIIMTEKGNMLSEDYNLYKEIAEKLSDINNDISSVLNKLNPENTFEKGE